MGYNLTNTHNTQTNQTFAGPNYDILVFQNGTVEGIMHHVRKTELLSDLQLAKRFAVAAVRKMQEGPEVAAEVTAAVEYIDRAVAKLQEIESGK